MKSSHLQLAIASTLLDFLLFNDDRHSLICALTHANRSSDVPVPTMREDVEQKQNARPFTFAFVG